MQGKKILIVTECFYPEEFKINDIALEWKTKGYDVDVLTIVPSYPLGKVFDGFENKFYQKENYQGINIYRVRAVTGYRESLVKKLVKYFNFMFLGSLISLFIGKKYDYIFGFNMSALTSMLPAVIIRKIYKKPLMFWAQDIWPESVYAYGFKKTKLLSYVLERFVKFMYHNVDSIAISSKGFENKLSPFVKNNLKFHYLPNWADDLNISLDSYEFSKEKKVHFTFAGNIGKVQNLENIIKAFALLGNKYNKKAQLNIIGDGSSYQELKNPSYTQNNIIFHGKKLRIDMAKYYNASDFLIVSLLNKPIFNATVPAKTQTYIAAQKPILAIINGETADLVKNNNLGYIANPEDIQEIKNTFIKCINTDKTTIDKFTKNSKELTDNIFNKEKIINSLEKLLVNES